METFKHTVIHFQLSTEKYLKWSKTNYVRIQLKAQSTFQNNHNFTAHFEIERETAKNTSST